MINIILVKFDLHAFFFLLIINKILWDVRYELVLAFEVLCARKGLRNKNNQK